MGWLWRKMPWYDWFFTAPLATNDLGFVSDQRVQVAARKGSLFLLFHYFSHHIGD